MRGGRFRWRFGLVMRRCQPPAFLKISAGGAFALYVGGRSGGAEVFAAPIPGGTLAPGSIDKFVRPLVIPPAMPRSGTNSYAIAVRQFMQEILPPPLPQTTVWGYGATGKRSNVQLPVVHHRGDSWHTGHGHMDQRADGLQRQLPRPSPAG